MGPLQGLKVVEFAGIGPGPMCAMTLADLGATVLRLDRVEPSGLGVQKPPRFDLLLRGRRIVSVNLKTEGGRDLALELLAQADALIEGFRPGVMERLGLGPETCLARNPRLVFGRMTGWGQDGPLSKAAGHDINYIALAGALGAIGRHGQPPTPPLNVVGDYAGAIYLALGMVSAILHAGRTGRGQVVDAAMIDTTAHLMTSFYGQVAGGLFGPERGSNVLDSGAPYYDVYPCRGGGYVAVGAIEPKFFADLLARLDLDPATLPPQNDRARWGELRRAIADRFLTRSRDEWAALLIGTDACFSPVLSMAEATGYGPLRERGVFVEIDGVVQPAPAPRFSVTAPDAPSPPPVDRVHAPEVALADWLDPRRIAELVGNGTLR